MKKSSFERISVRQIPVSKVKTLQILLGTGTACLSIFDAKNINDNIPRKTEQGVETQCHLCKCFGNKVDFQGHQTAEWSKRERKRYRNYQIFRVEHESRTVTFNVRGEEIKRVGEFNCLGRIGSEDDNDSFAIEANFKGG